MAKNSVNDYSTTAGNNTDVQSINIDEGMAPSNVNNAMREIMADLANAFQGGVTVTSVKAAALTGQTATFTAAYIGTYTAVSASRTITAGQGLSGGGDLAADRSLALDVANLTATATSAAGDYFPMYRTAATGTYKVLKSDLAGSTTAPGFVELATEAEAQSLTSTSVALTPASIATIGAPTLLETLTASGSVSTSGTLPACRAFLIVPSNVSGSVTSSLRLAVSADDGANWSGNVTISDSVGGSVSSGGWVLITNTGVTGNKLVHGMIGAMGVVTDMWITTTEIASVTGVINKIRFSPSSGTSDNGTFYIYGFR
jgi:hypothetical protein